jgi:hypothetical protein
MHDAFVGSARDACGIWASTTRIIPNNALAITYISTPFASLSVCATSLTLFKSSLLAHHQVERIQTSSHLDLTRSLPPTCVNHADTYLPHNTKPPSSPRKVIITK